MNSDVLGKPSQLALIIARTNPTMIRLRPPRLARQILRSKELESAVTHRSTTRPIMGTIQGKSGMKYRPWAPGMIQQLGNVTTRQVVKNSSIGQANPISRRIVRLKKGRRN